MPDIKPFAALLLLIVCKPLSAQQLHGKVTEGINRQPIAYAAVSTSSAHTLTSAAGYFSLPMPRTGDTLRISCMGYRPVSLVISSTLFPDTLPITLEPSSMMLKQVTIKAARNYRLDSLRNRQEFSKAFNYKPPALKDMFINRSSTAYVPYSYDQAPNNTTQLLSVNLLSLLAVAGKNKTPVTKLQKMLLRDEDANYVDHVFSKSRVAELTQLKGDSLQDFIIAYRPAIQQLKQMSTYDLMIYIKRSYQEFIKTNHHENAFPFKN